MKKFIFFDIVSLALCLESLTLQRGADSSMVQGEMFGFITHTNRIILNNNAVIHIPGKITLLLF